MRYVAIFALLVLSTLFGGCAGQAFVKSSQVRAGEIKEQKKILIVTNLGHHIGEEAFSYISTELPRRLLRHGLESIVLPLTTPDQLEQTDVRMEAKRYGSPYILSLTKGNGIIDEHGNILKVDVIASLSDSSNGRRLWGSRIEHYRGSTMFIKEEQKSSALIDALLNEFIKIGLVSNEKSTASEGGSLIKQQSNSTISNLPNDIEIRLKKLDELLDKKIITPIEYKSKRREIIESL